MKSDLSNIIQLIGYASVPVLLVWIGRIAAKQNAKEKAQSQDPDHFTVKMPKVVRWLFFIGFLLFGGITVYALASSTAQELWVILAFLAFTLLCFFALYASLTFRIEVSRKEDSFHLTGYLGRQYEIRYEDCISYKYRPGNSPDQDVCLRTKEKRITINTIMINFQDFIRILDAHGIPNTINEKKSRKH